MPNTHSKLQSFLEIALIFAVFALQGAWPVPDVNETHYLGKAAHYWNPAACPGDAFLESSDTHVVFYFSLGWLSLWLAPATLAWTGRTITWLLLAWTWRRLSAAVVPRAWYAVLTAALFGCLMDRCHMAGEWVIGGVEAKGFAYALVFLGLEFLVRNRWNRGLLFLGAAAAFHVLVGGWALVAAGAAWLLLSFTPLGRALPNIPDTAAEAPPRVCPPLRSLWPGLLGAFVLSLPGLIPSILLDRGVSAEIARQAHEIYVFGRLPHHLNLTGMRSTFIVRLALLTAFWLMLWKLSTADVPRRILRAFVLGTIAITGVGVLLHGLLWVDRGLTADLLRFYWFRMTDVAIPLGVALELAALIAAKFDRRAAQGATASSTPRRAWQGWCWLTLALAAAVYHVGDLALVRLTPAPPRSFKMVDYPAWLEACDWVAHSGKIPPHATFIIPRMAQAFRWHTGRAEVANWKDVPQNAQALVDWWRRLKDLFATNLPPPYLAWHTSPGVWDAARLRALGAKYHADYVLAIVPPPFDPKKARPEVPPPPPLPDLPEVYRNRSYVIYRLK